MRWRRWLELVTNYDMGILNHLVKTNVVRDALRKKPMAMYLTQQKEILNDMDGFELEVPL